MVTGFGRYGWSDRIGPLWFLQERWAVGPKWRRAWARFFAGPRGVAMQAHTKEGGYAIDGFYVDGFLWDDLSYGQKEDVVMGWIKAARRPDGGSDGAGDAHDPVWMHDVPAVFEYLVLHKNPDGTPRRTATLTVFTEHGAWKLFLNDRDNDASLCATGATFADALAALEVMLEAENTPWRWHDRQAKGVPGKGRKGS